MDRALPQLVVDTQALFLLRGYDHLGLRASPAASAALQQLCRSGNAAIATEARRLFGQSERRRVGDGDAA